MLFVTKYTIEIFMNNTATSNANVGLYDMILNA
jgi:hypothetical protein